jgi:CO/xanthine dehydrogenase FAD-binding subunit
VVDLQALDLNGVESRGNQIVLGAALTLERLLALPDLPAGLAGALQGTIRHEASYNLRQVATVAGTLVAAGGRSPFATALLALDASLELKQYGAEDQSLGLGEVLFARGERLAGKLITEVLLPANARLAYQTVSRTPADRPVVCAAAAQWPSGRTRVALGGFGAAPRLVLDGPEPGGAVEAAEDAYSSAGDEWASAEYRQAAAGMLVRRCLEEVQSLVV